MDRLSHEELRAGFARLQHMRAAIDARAPDILACHAAIEAELDLALAATLPRAERLRGLGFGQKVSVLQASTTSLWSDGVAPALIALNELRNCVAHGDRKKTRACYRALSKAVERMLDTEIKEELSVLALSNAIMAALLAIEHA